MEAILSLCDVIMEMQVKCGNSTDRENINKWLYEIYNEDWEVIFVRDKKFLDAYKGFYAQKYKQGRIIYFISDLVKNPIEIKEDAFIDIFK